MLIASMDTRISAGSTIVLNMKHVTIAATVNDYCNKQYYQCVTSAKCTNNNASQVLKKMRQLIYCLHYLAQDDMSTITWCKTPPIQRAEDWASRKLAKSLSLQDLVIEKLREYEIKVQNKCPVFWSTVKAFQEKGLIELASNHYTYINNAAHAQQNIFIYIECFICSTDSENIYNAAHVQQYVYIHWEVGDTWCVENVTFDENGAYSLLFLYRATVFCQMAPNLLPFYRATVFW